LSIYSDFNDLYKNDPALIETDLINIASEIDENNDSLFDGVLYDPKMNLLNGRKIYYSERSVNEKIGSTGIRTHLEAVVYYVLDIHGQLINDPNELQAAYQDLNKLIDKRLN